MEYGTIIPKGIAYIRKQYQNKRNRWISELDQRRGKNISVIAIANKNAHIAWALLSKKANYGATAA